MKRYKFVGDQPVISPEFGLDAVRRGAIVEVEQELNHPFFELVPDKPAKETSKAAAKEEAKPAQEEPKAASTTSKDKE